VPAPLALALAVACFQLAWHSCAGTVARRVIAGAKERAQGIYVVAPFRSPERALELREQGIPIIALNMVGSITSAVDLVVSDPVQAGTMAVMAISDTGSFDLGRQRGRRY